MIFDERDHKVSTRVHAPCPRRGDEQVMSVKVLGVVAVDKNRKVSERVDDSRHPLFLLNCDLVVLGTYALVVFDGVHHLRRVFRHGVRQRAHTLEYYTVHEGFLKVTKEDLMLVRDAVRSWASETI